MCSERLATETREERSETDTIKSPENKQPVRRLQSTEAQAMYKEMGVITADKLNQAILGHSLSNKEGGMLPH